MNKNANGAAVYFTLRNLLGAIKKQALFINQTIEQTSEGELMNNISGTASEIDTLADLALDKLEKFAV